jgi:phage terminase large subunit-like protein
MQISQTCKLADGRGHYPIGRIRAAAEWRAANAPGGQADRFTAVRELLREAQEYGADAIIGLEFHIHDVKRADVEGPALERVAVTGIAVKFAEAG